MEEEGHIRTVIKATQVEEQENLDEIVLKQKENEEKGRRMYELECQQ